MLRSLAIAIIMTICLLGTVLMDLRLGGPAAADTHHLPSPWLGQRFEPEQRTPLIAGETDFARKLCRITYRIWSEAPGFRVEAALYFNPKFVPRRPASVTLEILVLDRQGICIAQIDKELAVIGEPVPFTFTVADTAAAAVRTYYTLHYADVP